MPKVSVIIPAYNQAHFLDKSIRSVLDQTYHDHEIIVVDDGSSDNTREIASKYAGQVKYIWQENKGLAGARNTGIRAAQGELIGLLDSDDEWLPAYLEEMTGLAEKYPEAGVYYCSAESMDIDGNPLPQVFGGPAVPQESIYETLVRANFIIPSTVTLRKKVIMEAGLFDDRLRSCEDWDLWLRLLPEHQIFGTDKRLVHYRIHGSSLSTNPAGMQQAARVVIEKHFGRDDGQYSEWSDLKRRAFGGLYLYHAWTSILRKGDWDAAGGYLQKAFAADAELITSLDLYYEILLGRQSVGYRGTNQFLSLAENMAELEKIFRKEGFSKPLVDGETVLKKIFGAAYYAAGLLAYNSQNSVLSRKYLVSALRYRADLWADRRLLSLLTKSCLPQPLFKWLKTAKANLKKTQRTV